MLRKILRFCLCVILTVLAAVDVAATEDCDHEFRVIETEATCINLGTVYEECIHCGLQINYANTPALGHDFDQWITETPATCTKIGAECRACTRCGASEQRETEATGHDYEIEIVNPKCTIRGYTLTVCRNCGDNAKSDYTEAVGHDYELTAAEPGCIEAGYTQNTCKNCGKITQKKVQKALGHDYEPDENGTNVCRRCGDVETVIVPAVTEPRETEPAPKPTQTSKKPGGSGQSSKKPGGSTQTPQKPGGSAQAPTELAAEQPRETFFLRMRSGYPGWFRLADTGEVFRVDGQDPDIGPICGKGRVHFLWGFGASQRIWLQWARMEE